ncbi:ATP-binding cassette domain-containing protein [Levilactobacillus fuyuanensis]|uniref:ATP-binding cassette domain-containing protein n=1 Tax=Levilactobacillus fuyuanensis TaxID=2486022 RepID=A0ABW4H414_9LACO|nr:ABC transporter ATP-binding protein [Levilactobacillus fuyuanensis]
MTDSLSIQNVTYKRGMKTILHDANLTLAPGKIVGLLGENGAGKTTLMRLITGSAKGAGDIMVSGDTAEADRKRHVSFSEQLRGFAGNTKLTRIIAFYETVYEDFEADRFTELATFLQIDTSLKLAALSKGMKEKLVIALTLARRTNLYLLDEPFSGIDSMSRKKIINSIIQWKPENATMVISDHYVSEIAPILDEIVIVKDQTIYAHRQADEVREEFHIGIEAYYESLYERGNDND